MSNAIDILFVGGPKHGHLICAPLPNSSTYSVPGADGEFVYQYRKHIYAMQQYNIAVLQGVAVRDDEINDLIVALRFPSDWRQRQPEVPVGA